MRNNNKGIIHIGEARISILKRQLFFFNCFQQTKLLSKRESSFQVLESTGFQTLTSQDMTKNITKGSKNTPQNPNTCISPSSKIKILNGQASGTYYYCTRYSWQKSLNPQECACVLDVTILV